MDAERCRTLGCAASPRGNAVAAGCGLRLGVAAVVCVGDSLGQVGSEGASGDDVGLSRL